jgi:hypothetical protein
VTPPQVPPLPSEWPPTSVELAGVVTTVHWELADLAFDLPRGQASRDRLVKTATVLEQLARLLVQHSERDVGPGGGDQDGSGVGQDLR